MVLLHLVPNYAGPGIGVNPACALWKVLAARLERRGVISQARKRGRTGLLGLLSGSSEHLEGCLALGLNDREEQEPRCSRRPD